MLRTGSSSRECQSIMRPVQESAHATTQWTTTRVTRKNHELSLNVILLLENDRVYYLFIVGGLIYELLKLFKPVV